jgi:NADPH:quinone reductase
MQGLYQDKPPLPFIPGSEVSGVITEVGPKVKSFKVGDRVIAITQTGGFAEQVVVHEAAAVKLPSTVDLAAAAGAPPPPH